MLLVHLRGPELISVADNPIVGCVHRIFRCVDMRMRLIRVFLFAQLLNLVGETVIQICLQRYARDGVPSLV